MFLSAGGHLLNAVRWGQGPRAFVAHGGWVGSWELWQQPFELMQERWTCIAYDHRGSGASTAPAEAVDPRGLVDDLFAVLDHYEVESCVLAGESLGALTVLAAALRDPGRFAGLVLVDGASSTTGEVTDRSAVRADYPAYVRRFVSACVPEPDSQHVRRWGEQILLRADPEAAARMFETHEAAAFSPDLGALAMPVLVIHGELDAIVPVAMGAAVAQSVPDGELVVLPGAGHVPTMTRPAEVVAAIDDWAARRLP